MRLSLIQRLFRQAPRFDFFQAVRLLTRLARGERRPIGRDATPGQEVVRFTSTPTLLFLTAPIRSLQPSEAPGGPAVMSTAVLPLTGPSGALPYRYTEELIERSSAHRDETPAAFLDLFHHRFTSLFYRAWEKHRPALAVEQSLDARQPPGSDWFANQLLAIAGLGIEGSSPTGATRLALLPYAGLLADRRRPAFGLEAILYRAFRLSVTVVPFIPRRIVLQPEDRSALGLSGRHNALGVNLMAGTSVCDVTGTFRLRIGPLPIQQFRALSPGTPVFDRVCQLTRLYIGQGLQFEVQPILQARDVPRCRLVSERKATRRLGRDTWLQSTIRRRDAADAVFAAPGV